MLKALCICRFLSKQLMYTIIQFYILAKKKHQNLYFNIPLIFFIYKSIIYSAHYNNSNFILHSFKICLLQKDNYKAKYYVLEKNQHLWAQ